MKYAEVQVRIPNLEGDAIAEVHTLKVPVTIDPDTGEELLTEEAVEMIDNTKARYMGLLLPNEIKELRQRLGLTQKQMSEVLQAGEKSYTRWETGRARPSRMVNVLLRLLFERKVTVDQIRSVGTPRTQTPAGAKFFPAADWSKVLAAPIAQQAPVFPFQAHVDVELLRRWVSREVQTFVPKVTPSTSADRAQRSKEHRMRYWEAENESFTPTA